MNKIAPLHATKSCTLGMREKTSGPYLLNIACSYHSKNERKKPASKIILGTIIGRFSTLSNITTKSYTAGKCIYTFIVYY